MKNQYWRVIKSRDWKIIEDWNVESSRDEGT
jgi:hypothetical protein